MWVRISTIFLLVELLKTPPIFSQFQMYSQASFSKYCHLRCSLSCICVRLVLIRLSNGTAQAEKCLGLASGSPDGREIIVFMGAHIAKFL